MSEIKQKQIRKNRRKKRVSIGIVGTTERPRISVYRSNQHMFVQVIDDQKQVTIASCCDAGKDALKGTKTEKAVLIGQKLGKMMEKLGVKSAVFDRGSYRYLGRVRSLADAIRSSGITI